LIFFVFSYNRGPHLKNCVESIERCAPGSGIVVYDDQSDDPETKRILDEIARRHEVRSSADRTSREQHGALYANMQSAIESVPDDRILFFIQDDTQLVRPLTPDDEDFIRGYFKNHSRAGFLSPVFQKRITRQSTLNRFQYNRDRGVYNYEYRSRKKVAGVYYSDVSITMSSRLREINWKFLAGEYANELQAKANFLEMGYLYAPFVMWLPNPPAYRNKKKSLAFRIAEKINKAGFYPYKTMRETDIERLKNRAPSQVPIAEDFLEVSVPGLKAPWIFHPLRRSRLLRKLDKLESLGKRLYKAAP
jgi:glycosyltransferase involved in cell wall biosynthesis